MKLFKDKLNQRIEKFNTLLCIGLDSDKSKLPSSFTSQFKFNKAIIGKTHDLVCAYKPNTAFYEAQGVQGIKELKLTCDYLRENYPDIVIILDAKRADIGNTSESYAKFAFDYLGADAVTLHPYLGKDALQPFLDRKEKGSIVLCKTSNPGAKEIQNLKINSKPLYQILAKKIAGKWNENNNCGLVVGATYPAELAIVRKIAPNMPFLIPGVGAQGGELDKSVGSGVDKNGKNAIINVARSIIFASKGRDFAEISRRETEKLKLEINKYRNG